MWICTNKGAVTSTAKLETLISLFLFIYVPTNKAIGWRGGGLILPRLKEDGCKIEEEDDGRLNENEEDVEQVIAIVSKDVGGGGHDADEAHLNGREDDDGARTAITRTTKENEGAGKDDNEQRQTDETQNGIDEANEEIVNVIC